MSDTRGINRLELSQLRPGMPVAALIHACGSKWKPPGRRAAGFVYGPDLGAPFAVHVTVDEKIGAISFLRDFPSKYLIESVHVGMPQDAALAARPTLQRTPREVEGGIAHHFESLSDSLELRVAFRNGQVLAIELSDPLAKYPDPKAYQAAPPGRYPEPVEPAGAPFADPNLKLWALAALVADGHVDLGDPEELAMHVLARYVDLEHEGYEPIAAVRDYLVRYPLSPELLAKVEAIGGDAASDVYRCIWYHWGGEEDLFDVRSLDGIAACVNLRRLSLDMMVAQKLDLQPLAGLPRLEDIELSLERDKHTPLKVLLSLPSLRSITTHDDPRNDAALVAELKLKAVRVKLL